MSTVPVVVIGAGPAGLAVSHELGVRGIEHVVLEKGRTAESWRSRRWDSLRLLSPAWATRLPGLPPPVDPDAFPTAGALVTLLERYATGFAAPVVEHADVLSVRRCDDRYRVVSTAGSWTAAAVVLATGDAAAPAVPAVASGMPSHLCQLTSDAYRRPEQLPDGGVLVVGASASGVQIADELASSGRDVVLAVGRHTRMVRRHRGVDVYRWMERLGSLDRRLDRVADPAAALQEPSLQIAGHGADADARDLSLPALASRGVRLAGRLTGIEGGRARFADDLAVTTADADARLTRFLQHVEDHVRSHGLDGALPDAAPMVLSHSATRPLLTLGLRGGGIRTVLWATGYRAHHPWLHVPVLDPAGRVLHDRGLTPSPGLYVVGQRWQTTRSSGFLAGMGRDAELVVSGLARRLGRLRPHRPHPPPPRPRGADRMTTPRWDVVVVGARVAGSATAMLLARAGLRVLVLDRMRPGADALSTHALMRAGTLQLQRWGLLDRVAATGTPPVRRTVFHYGDGETVPVSLKPAAGVDALYAPRRTVLDPILAGEAERCGATVEYGATVTSVLRGGDGTVTGVRVRDAAGRERDEGAGLVVGADGRASLVAAQVGAPTLVAGRSASSVVYGYFTDLPAEGYEWYWSLRRSAGVIPTTGGLSCVFVGAPPGDVALLRGVLGPQAQFRTLAGQASPQLVERLDAAAPVERLRHDTGHPGHLRTATGPGWALVGDSGYWKDPLSTHGITDALRDAELLARAVVTAGEAGGTSSSAGAAAMNGYQATRDRLSMQMVDVVDRVASFDWDLTAVRGLLRELASAMTDEVEALSELTSAA